jgi:hypothetical protein
MQVSSQLPPGTIRHLDIRDNGTIVVKTYDGERREYRQVEKSSEQARADNIKSGQN